MADFDRRQWLKTAGWAGAFSLLGGANSLANNLTPSGLSVVAHNTTNGIIRLSSNENPYGPSGKVRQAMIDAFHEVCRYPFGYSGKLADKIAQKHGVTKDHIVITGGSTEGLKAAGLIYGLHGGEIVAAEPTFLSLMEYAEQFGAYVHYVPVDKHLTHDLEAMEKRLTGSTRLIFVCNPNNPTGTLLPAETMKNFCENLSARMVVFADEAYFDYITEPNYPSMVELVKQDLNVIVSRTFSKIYGLAGIRLGYLIARPDIAQRLRESVMANTNVLAIFAALKAMEDEEFYKFSLEQNQAGKEIIYKALDELNLPYIKSHANFVFFNAGKDIRELQGEFFMRGIQIGRPFPPLMEWCRISTGTIEEVQAFVKVLKEVV